MYVWYLLLFYLYQAGTAPSQVHTWSTEKLQVLKEQMQAKMSGLSGEAQNIAKKALELIEQGKSGNDIEAEVC